VTLRGLSNEELFSSEMANEKWKIKYGKSLEAFSRV
jgi:hypothetical protein